MRTRRDSPRRDRGRLAVLAVALGGVRQQLEDRSPAATTTARHSARAGTINVLAASSLTKAFTALATQFEAAHPGTKVNLNFASSSTFVGQIQNGAPADVFASADQKNMQKLQTAGDGDRTTPTVFAKNQMEIAVVDRATRTTSRRSPTSRSRA